MYLAGLAQSDCIRGAATSLNCPPGWDRLVLVNPERSSSGTGYSNHGSAMCCPPARPQYAPQPTANINVSVPTNVNTQVSPQISPILVQQDQPQNSSVGAQTGATSQTAAQPDTAMQEYLRQLAQQQTTLSQQIAEERELQRERDEMLYAATQSQQGYEPASPQSISIMGPESPAPVVMEQQPNWMLYALIAAGIGGVAYIAASKRKKGN